MREPAFVFLRWRHGDQPVGAEGGRRPQATVPAAIGLATELEQGTLLFSS